jgi:hypothetical protein
MLATRIVRSGPLSGWITSDSTDDIPVRVVPSGPDGWDAVLRDELLRPFDLTAGPLTRLVVVDGTDGFALAVVCHHLVADGLSATYALRDVLHHLGDPTHPPQPAVTGPPAEALVAKRRDRSPARRRPLPADRATGPVPSSASGELAIRCWSLDPTRSAGLVERCRREGTTVHAALCTAFLRAFADVDSGPGVRWVETPANLRHTVTLPAHDTVGLYIAIVQTPVDVGGDPDFWTAARTFRADLAEQTGAGALHERVRRLRWLALIPTAVLRRLAAASQVRYDLSVTNLGAVGIPVEYGPLRVDALQGPTLRVHEQNHRVLGVATLRGQLHFSLTSLDRDLMDRVSTRAMEHLDRATG